MGLWLWAPNDVEAYLNTTYDMTKCQTVSWSHRLERRIPAYSVDCKRLYPFYQFVFRSTVRIQESEVTVENSVLRVIEELRLNGSVLNTVQLDNVGY